MKRPAEYLVRKRDGRHEYLRSTKLAHSIHRVLCAVGAAEEWLPMELATTVVAGLRVRMAQQVAASCTTEEREVLSTDDIAIAVEHVLTATGYAQAAQLYANAGAEQRRRQALLADRQLPPSISSEYELARCAPSSPANLDPWATENRFSAN